MKKFWIIAVNGVAHVFGERFTSYVEAQAEAEKRAIKSPKNTFLVLGLRAYTIADHGEVITVDYGEEGGTLDYDELYNKPAIDGIILTKESTAHELGLVREEEAVTKQQDPQDAGKALIVGADGVVTPTTIDMNSVWEAGEGEGSVITKINAKEGVGGSAKGAFAVSEGWGTVASGESSHTEGRMTMVIHAADCAHAEGNGTTAGGRASHTEGVGTVTSNMAEHAEGHYNKTNQATTVFGDAGNTLSSIGIGSGNLEIDQGRKNAVEVMQNGDAYLIGIGNYDGKNVSEADTLQEVVNSKQDKLDFISLKRLDNYVYEATFDKIPDHIEMNNSIAGGCSAYVKGEKLYRNLDWKYNNTATFIIKCKDFEGIAFIDGLEDSNLDFKKVGQLPYHLVDGVNKNGIMISTHVLFNDWSYKGCGEKDKDLQLLPLYILQNLHSIDDISAVLSNYLSNIKISETLLASGYLIQYLITDGTTTYIITPPTTDNTDYQLVDVSSLPKLTNFKWLNKANLQRNDPDLQTHPTGIERWNSIDFNNIKLEDLRFTKCYEEATRLSEFIGENNTTKDSTDEELTEIYNIAHASYLTRTRDGRLWQTCHSVVYGVNGIEHLYCQENFNKDYISVSSNYNDLTGQPSINGVTLTGNKTSSDLGLADTSLSNITDGGKITAAHLAMPSATYDELSPSAADNPYVAPADGYFNAKTVNISSEDYGWLVMENQTNGMYLFNGKAGYSKLGMCMPVKKGDAVKVSFDGGSGRGLEFLRFYYAVGSESEQQGA